MTVNQNLVLPDTADEEETSANGDVPYKLDNEGIGNITTVSYRGEHMLLDLPLVSLNILK